MIEVEGKKYKVTEDMGFQGRYYLKAVQTEDGEKIAKKVAPGKWTFWTAQNRLGKE